MNLSTTTRRILQTGALLVLLVCSTFSDAQISTATLFGQILDNSGASIPGATVVITQADTHYTRTLKTGDDGSYRADFLPVGPYTIHVDAPGFKALERSGVVLTVTEEAHLDLPLELGAASEVVNVTAEVPLVNAGNSTIGRTIDNAEVDNLPLVNRNAYQLLNLTPGVQSSTNIVTLGYPEQHVIINGSTDGTVGQISHYLDGGVNMTGFRNTGNILPNPDAIREFSVQTSNFSAQFGRTSAGIVSVLTKSGTNQFHGSVFEFNRNTLFNASTHNAGVVLPLHRNQFGATAGGPIFKDKTFFFGSYAGLRQSQGFSLTSALVPDAKQRAGNFSENLPTSSGAITSCTQAINAADNSNKSFGGRFVVCNPVTRRPYANNIITDPLDPAAVAVMNRNIPLPTNATLNSFTGSYSLPYVTDEFLAKIDHQLTSSHRLAVNYFQSNGHTGQLPPGGNLPTWSFQNFVWRQQNANLSDTWTINPTAINQVWGSYVRLISARINTPAVSISDYGSDLNVQGPPQLPQISVNGWFTLGQAIAGPLAATNVFNVRDVLSINRGKHSLFLGGEVSHEVDGINTLLNNYGIFAYTNSTTARTGNALSDFVLGRPNTMNQDAPVYANATYWTYGFFAQDDWRITPKLTLNLGVRYDVQQAPSDTQNRQTNFVAGRQSVVIPNAPTGMLFPGDTGVPKTGTVTRYNHASPRIGAAYDPFGNGRTIFHAGAGLFFGSIGGNEFQFPSNFQPYAVRAQYNRVVSMTHPYSTDTAEFPGGVSPYPYTYSPTNTRFIRPVQVVAMDPNYKWPYDFQMNFGVQQQFTNSLAIGIAYVGSLNRKLPLYVDQNYPIFNAAAPTSNTTATSNNRRPVNVALGTANITPTYSNVYVITSNQTSNYHGLQVTLEQRLGKYIGVKSFYTWSKTLASAAMDANALNSPVEDFLNPGLDKQRSDFDMRHQSVTSVVFKPDFYSSDNRYMRSALNGWTLTAIVTLQSGAPFNITTGADNNGDGTSNDRPNVVAGRIAQLANTNKSRVQAMNQWFDPTIFCGYSSTAPTNCQGTGPGGSDGTLRPNALDSPGIRNVDASLFRDFPLYDRVKFQFRAEFANVFNLTNLGTPTGTLNSANAGKITGSASGFPNRQIQLGARILF